MDIINSKAFEEKINTLKATASGGCTKKCSSCPLQGSCEGMTDSDIEHYLKKFVAGDLVFSKGELIEKTSLHEEFTILVNENTGEVKVTPEIYEGDEMLQSTIFKDIEIVFLNKVGKETKNKSDNHMVKIPKIHYEMTNNNGVITINVSRNPIGRCLAHTTDTGVEKEFLYISKFLCDKELKSLPNKEPLVNISHKELKEKLTGLNGWAMLGFHQLTLLQILYLLRVQALDSKKELGKGVTNASSKKNTGGSPNCLFYGDDSGVEHVVMCGIEDFFGNVYVHIDGLWTDKTHVCVKMPNGEVKRPTNFGGGELEHVIGTTEFGFCPLIK